MRARIRRPDSAGPEPRRATVRSGGSLLKSAGRVALWATVALLLVRGAGDVLAGPPPGPAERAGGRPAAAAFPNDEARAFAADFARAYLTYSPRHPDYHALGVRGFLASELRESGALEVPQRGPTQTVDQATVARAERTAPDRALITVAATVSNRTVTTRYLTVPVARDAAGGLVVYDYPSFSAPPARAEVEEPQTVRLEGREQREIEDVLGRFLAAYFAGRSDDLAYFLPAGTSLQALSERYELRELISVAAVGEQQGSRRTVLATVRARDAGTKATYVLRYRVGLERRDRWYVASVNANQGR